MPLHPDQTPKPAPIYSDDPEVVFPNQPSQGPVSPSSDTYSHTTQSLLDALRSSYATTPINRPPERQYPNQPDSIGQELACDTPQSMPAPSEKAYPGQPLPQQGQGYLQPFYTPSCHPSGYSSAVPLHSLQSASCPVDCPVCEQREMTRIEPVSGGTTHGWATVLCCCCCLGCIPYLMSSLKDVVHSCGKCGAKLAKWHNSGRVDVLQNPRK